MTLRNPLWILALLLLAAPFAAACGGDDDSSATATQAPRTSEVPAGAPAIDQNELAFKPSSLTVNAGTQVYFKNSETAIHTVTIEGKNISGVMKKGDVVVWTAPSAGTFKVTCDYHPQMRATITVK